MILLMFAACSGASDADRASVDERLQASLYASNPALAAGAVIARAA